MREKEDKILMESFSYNKILFQKFFIKNYKVTLIMYTKEYKLLDKRFLCFLSFPIQNKKLGFTIRNGSTEFRTKEKSMKVSM